MADEWERMKVPSREELAWLSGVFCGEGSFSPRRYKDAHTNVIFAVTQTAPAGAPPPEMLLRIQAMLGIGRIHRTATLSRLANPKFRVPWQYVIGSFMKTQAVLAMIWPWLTPEKKEQATRVFAMYHAENNARPTIKRPPRKTRVQPCRA